jgi:catechol 2,3-dioxygenase-like lactoylglutathione lyase family enzyme
VPHVGSVHTPEVAAVAVGETGRVEHFQPQEGRQWEPIPAEESAVAVQLNHTIVPVQDKHGSANFLAEILGLDPPKPFGPFMCVETANGVSLDYDDRGALEHHHYAFLVTEVEFDAIFARVTERGIKYWADPGDTSRRTASTITDAVHFEDPSGHNMEVLTRPYGS